MKKTCPPGGRLRQRRGHVCRVPGAGAARPARTRRRCPERRRPQTPVLGGSVFFLAFSSRARREFSFRWRVVAFGVCGAHLAVAGLGRLARCVPGAAGRHGAQSARGCARGAGRTPAAPPGAAAPIASCPSVSRGQTGVRAAVAVQCDTPVTRERRTRPRQEGKAPWESDPWEVGRLPDLLGPSGNSLPRTQPSGGV